MSRATAVLHGWSHWRWFTQICFKASKFIAVHFLIAFTMEIVQIFILNSIAFERSQSFWYLLQSFMKIYIKLVLFLKFKHYNIQRDYIMFSRGKKIFWKPSGTLCLDKTCFLPAWVFYSPTNSFNKPLLTSTFQALSKALGGLRWKDTGSFTLITDHTRDRHA